MERHSKKWICRFKNLAYKSSHDLVNHRHLTKNRVMLKIRQIMEQANIYEILISF